TLLDRELVVRRDGHWHATQEINQIELPNTLNGVLTARLDALDESSKRVLQTAAVAGREFDDGQVSAVVDNSATLDAALLELQRRELIREKGLLRTGGQATGPAHRMYIFKHALTQESAYESVLRGDRRDMHRAIAEFLESNRPDGISDIARHLFAAGEPDRALPYIVTAANSSAKAYATDEAIAGYRQACEIIENRGAQADPVLARQVFEGLGGTLSFSNRTDEAIETYDRMREIAELLGADEMRVSAMNKTAFIYGVRRGELERADKALQLSEKVALSCNDMQGQAERHMTNCYIQTTLGEFGQAYDSLRTAARIGRETDNIEARLFGLVHIANTLLYMGRFDESYEMANEALEIAIETGHKMWEAELKSFAISFYHLRCGDLATSYKFAREGADIAARISAGQGEAAGRFMQSLIARMNGRFDEALEIGGQALAVSQSSGLTYFEAAISAQLGSIELDISADRATATAQLHQQSLEALEKPLGTAMGAMTWAELGFCALSLGDAEMAKQMFEKGLTISTSTKILARPQLLMGRAMLQMMDGDIPRALATVDEAQRLADSDGMQHYSPFFGLMRGMMNGASGESEFAMESFNESKTEALRLGMLPVALQATTAIAGIVASQSNGQPVGDIVSECEKLISEIAASINDTQISDAFSASARAKLPR
ncbi:MAG: hypothetical protein O6922_04220, partial [Chloroflexi bacterium]|nr:hypothetical protein [Chloroflexota bacterium]